MLCFYFYGDRMPNGTRELLEIHRYHGKKRSLTKGMFKSLLNAMSFLEANFTQNHKVVCYIFRDKKIAKTIVYNTFEMPNDYIIKAVYYINGKPFKFTKEFRGQ